jgi:hypothetical protein
VLLYTLAAVQINEINGSNTSPPIKRLALDMRRSDALPSREAVPGPPPAR